MVRQRPPMRLWPHILPTDATLRTMALGTLILNAFSVRAAPGRFIQCRCSAIQNNVQTNAYDPRRPERHRRFYLAVQTSRESSIILATAYHSLRYPNPFRRSLQYEIQHWPSACNSSARQLLAGASFNRCRTVTRLLQTVCSTDDADNNRTALLARPTASSSGLRMLATVPHFTQWRKYNGRHATSHLCQKVTCASFGT